MKKAVFIEPSSTHLHVYSRLTIPRLGSVLLGTIMRNRGWDVKVFIEDIAPVDMDEVLSADIVGISGITSTAPPCYRLAAKVRRAGIPVVLGGTHVSFLPDEGLDHAEYVVRGEGEFAFPELVEAMERGRGFERIQGLSFWRDGQKVHNPERPRLADLDVNPIPDFSLVEGYGKRSIVSVATSRGCPFPCTFCSVPGMYGSNFRTHSIDRVIEEMRGHAGVPYVFFADDIFTANRKRTKDLLSRMIAEGVTPLWGAQVRTETVDDDELLNLMRRSNCFNVFVGFESINPKTLKLFKKKQDLAKIERSIQKFHDTGIKIHGMFVVGSDEDDVETIYQTAQFARDQQIESIQLMILTPIPGSPDWTTIYSQGKKDIICDNWELYDGHHCVHQPRKISPYELQMAAMKATEQFYSWGAILEPLVKKRDLFTAALRFSAKRLLKDWWKDPENQAYTQKLRDELYAERQRAGRDAQGAVAVPEVFMQDQIGRLLERFLHELGVRVTPVTEPAAEALHRLRETVDVIITPIVQRAAKGTEELVQRLGAVTAAIQSNLDKLPRVIQLPVNFEQGPVFEPFAKVGLLFTGNLNSIRQAYNRAGEVLGLWGDAAAAAQPSPAVAAQ